MHAVVSKTPVMSTVREIARAFHQQARAYEQYAKAQQVIGQRLFERLDYLKITPAYVLDLGCGTGWLSRLLQKKYPKACVVGLDAAQAMLTCAKRKQHFWRKWPLACADMEQMPFADGVFDLVFSNQTIHWGKSVSALLREVNRVMAPDGCFMFSTLGPDTFKELRTAWAQVDNHAHVNTFIDLHDWGDALLAEYFLDPVMDMESLTLHYPSPEALLTSLKHQGVRNMDARRNPGLTGRQARKAFEAAYETHRTPEGKYPLYYEVVYGHAWKGVRHSTGGGSEVRIPVTAIKKRAG